MIIHLISRKNRVDREVVLIHAMCNMKKWFQGASTRPNLRSLSKFPRALLPATMIPSRLLAATLIRTARPALQVSCRKFPHRYQRSFSVTPRFQATPTDGIEAFTAAFKKTSVFKKLANHPEAITALESFARALQDAGICFSLPLVAETMRN